MTANQLPQSSTLDTIALTGRLPKRPAAGRSAVVLQLADRQLMDALEQRRDATTDAAEWANLSSGRRQLARRLMDREARIQRKLAAGAVL